MLVAFSLGSSLILKEGLSIAPLILLLISIYYVSAKKAWSFDYLDCRLMLAFLAYFLSMMLFVYLDGWHTRELDRPARFLLAIPVLFVLLTLPYQRNWLWGGVMLGAFGAFLLAIYEKFLLGMERASGLENPIMFGNTSLLLGLLSFCAFLYYQSQHKSKIWPVCASLAASSGVMASLLSGTRGGWIALPIIGFFLFWQSRDVFNKSLFKILGAFFIILSTAVVTLPQFGVVTRIQSAVDDIQRYQQGELSSNSVGQRFEMWKGALYLFEMSPLLGVGEYRSKELKLSMEKEGLLDKSVIKFDHAHNEYLTSLSLRGIVGLFFLMVVYLVPLKLFLGKIKEHSDNWNIKSYALAGALIPMSYMDFAITQSMFSHNIGVMFYAFSIAFFWAAVRLSERQSRGAK